MRHMILSVTLSLLLLFALGGCGRDNTDSAWARPGRYYADQTGHVAGFQQTQVSRQSEQLEDRVEYSMRDIREEVPRYIR